RTVLATHVDAGAALAELDAHVAVVDHVGAHARDALARIASAVAGLLARALQATGLRPVGRAAVQKHELPDGRLRRRGLMAAVVAGLRRARSMLGLGAAPAVER